MMNPTQQLKEDVIDPQIPDDAVAQDSDTAPREPFASMPDKGFFYTEPTRAQRLKLLHHLAPYGELLIVTGEAGSGKTSLMEQFVSRAHDTWRLCVIAAYGGLSKGHFLDALIDGFSIQAERGETDEGKLQQLKGHCSSLKRNGLLPIVVIDDAHQLSREDLRVLLRLLQSLDDYEKPLRVILFAAPPLREVISGAEFGALQQRVTHTFNLLPLSEKETANYINHRLKVAGISGEGLFTDTVVKMIHRTSQGLPGKINELARVVLVNRNHAKQGKAEALLATKRTGKGGRIWNSLPFGIALGILGLAAILYFNRSSPPKAVEDHIARSNGAEALVPLSLPPDDANESPQTATGPDTSPPAVSAPVPVPASPPSAGAPKSTAQADIATTAEASAPPPPQEQPPEAPKQTPPVATKSAPAVKQPPPPRAAAAPAKPKPAAVAAAPPAAPPPAAGKVRDAAWVLAQDPAHYTLQLMASKQAAALDRIVRRPGVDPGEFAHFRLMSRGEAWHVLAYGQYPSRETAATEVNHLPAALHAFKPWIRSMGDLQAAIKLYQAQHP